jgi:hypothetical protein
MPNADGNRGAACQAPSARAVLEFGAAVQRLGLVVRQPQGQRHFSVA